MTNAIISGQAKTALLINGNRLLSFDIDTPEILKPRRQSDFRFLFGEATDLRFLQNIQQKDVLTELRADYYKTSALDLALMLLDKDISDAKPLIGEALEELFDDENIIIHLESIFYAKPLPADADAENALRACENTFQKTFNWLSTLIAKQDDITWVKEIWDAIATDVFGDEERRADFQKVIVHEGIFRKLVLHCRNISEVSSINVTARMNRSVTALPNHRNVLQALFTPFNQPRVSTQEKSLLKDEEKQTIVPRQKGRLKIDRQAVQNNVEGQIDYIVTALRKRDIALARRLTNELAEYQSGKGEPIHLVKSLCQLARKAKDFGYYKFQLELIERAVGLEYSDSWTQTQYGDALLQNNRLDEAIKTYAIAISFSKGKDTKIEIVARRGYAEVLKAQGRLDESLKVYEEVMQSHPEDIFSRNGYAEILKAQGRLDEALLIYEETIKSHPENIVVRRGYAEILKAQGRLDESLKIYQEVMQSHPEDVVTRNGYAEVLKAQGRLDESLKIYQEVMQSHPDDTFSRNGYAEVLKAQGKFGEALLIYEETIKSHPENVVVRTGYAEILKAQGRLDEALLIYEETIKSHPENVVVRNGYAEILKEQGKLGEALQIYEETMQSHPEEVVARNGYAEILKAQGRLDEALLIYEETMQSHPEDVVTRNGYAEVLKAQGKFGEALDIYQETMQSHPKNVVARNGLCGVLFSLKRYDEALEKLQNENLVTLSDWIGYHIRGMIMLRKGNLAEAIKIFEKGEKEDPIPASREYFRGALAIARLRQGEFRQAGELLDKVTSPVLQPAINIFRAHTFGEMKMYPQAEAAFRAYENAPISRTIAGYQNKNTLELAFEVDNRYVANRIRTQTDDWLFDREEDLLLALAP